MNPVRRRLLAAAAAALAAPVPSRQARGQAYPVRSVRAIVPFAPGGATDIVARLVLQELSKQLGQPFYVENVPGAGGNIGTGRAAKAAPDGYTVLFAFSSHVTNPFMYATVPYQPSRDFAPVTLVVTCPAVITVHPSFPAKTLQELIALVRAHPGKYAFASGGTGTQPHLAGEQLRLALGLDLVHVPHNGGGPALVSAVGGHTPICFTTLSPAVPLLHEGKLRALAVTGRTRAQAVPDVPTIAEAGHPDIEGDTWVGVLAPAETAPHIVGLLHREIVRVLAQPAMKERLVALGYEPVGSTPEAYAAQIRTELARWDKIIRSVGIRAQ